MNYPEQQMLKILNRDLLSNPMYVINNLHIYDWESDFLAITRVLAARNILRKGISELESMGNSGCRNAGVPYVCIQESHLL